MVGPIKLGCRCSLILGWYFPHNAVQLSVSKLRLSRERTYSSHWSSDTEKFDRIGHRILLDLHIVIWNVSLVSDLRGPVRLVPFTMERWPPGGIDARTSGEQTQCRPPQIRLSLDLGNPLAISNCENPDFQNVLRLDSPHHPWVFWYIFWVFYPYQIRSEPFTAPDDGFGGF